MLDQILNKGHAIVRDPIHEHLAVNLQHNWHISKYFFIRFFQH